jgi:aminoglycoside phosphotransferase (APT) family kinase protein
MDPPGWDTPAFTAWYRKHVRDLDADAPVNAQLITGGRSNLTYSVDVGDDTVVVRRPPMGHVLATAHDMTRERKMIHALHPTDVPVPTVIGWSDDPDVLGAPFFVMEKLVGEVYRDADQLESLAPPDVHALATRMIDVLVVLHSVGPESVGLDQLGKATGYLERQVHRWTRQLAGSHTRDIAGLDELRRRLEGSIPNNSRSALVHGDYRLDNLIVRDGEVQGVLDWEMATLGDPMSDLALLIIYQHLARLAPAGTVPTASEAPGYPSPVQILERYASSGGDLPPETNFHLGLAAYKLVGILEGIHHRHLDGQTVGPGFVQIGECVEPLVALGLELSKETH